MAFTLVSGNITAGAAETEATLKTYMDANPSNGMYEGGAFIFRGCGLSIPSGTSLTISDGSILAFDDAVGYRVNLVGTLDFKFGGGIVYNGNVQFSFFNGRLDGENINYTLNGNATNGRSDFFSPTTSSLSTIKNLSLFYGKGASGYSYFTHLEPLAGRIDGLTFINNIQTALGGGSLNVQFGNGTYNKVSFPKQTSNFGIATALNIYLARSGGNSALTNPVINDSSLTIVGDQTGTAELRDETWSSLGSGKMGKIVAGAYNSAQTTVSRTQSFNVGSLYDNSDNIFLRITDSQGTPTVYKNGAVTAADTYILQWASYVRNGNTQTNRYPFNLVARRWNMVEQAVTYNYTANANDWTSPFGNSPFTYTALNVLDAYATTKQTSLTNISFNSSTKIITVSGAMTIDNLYDFAKYYLTQNLSVANMLSPSGKELELLSSWTIAGLEFLSAGTKLTSIKVSTAATANGAISNLSITGNVTQATATNLNNVTITGSLTYNDNTSKSVTFTNAVIGTVSNSGTGIITITKSGTTAITTYTDAEINYLDSTLSFDGITSLTFYPTQADRDAGTNAGATASASPYNFKFGSTVNGVLLSGTVYLRINASGVLFLGEVNLVLGNNTLSLSDNTLLQAIVQKLDINSSNLVIVNEGVKKASLLVPHNTDLT